MFFDHNKDVKRKKKKRKAKLKALHQEPEAAPSYHLDWSKITMGPSIEEIYGPKATANLTISTEGCEVTEDFSQTIIHVVKKSEGLWPIARMYFGYMNEQAIAAKVEQIKKDNNLETDVLKPGQQLTITQMEEERERSLKWVTMEGGKSSYVVGQSSKLEGAKKEVPQINTKYSDEHNIKAVYGEEHNEEEFKKMFFNEYHKYWHLATHGTGGDVNTAMKPFILTVELFKEGKKSLGQDGAITTEEISKFPLKDVELIFINACETALANYDEKQTKTATVGEAALVAGAENSISTYWTVNDDAALQMAVLFYDNLFVKKMSIDDALRSAQLSLMQTMKAPKYWAAYKHLNKDNKKEDYSTGDVYENALQEGANMDLDSFKEEELKAKGRVEKLEVLKNKYFNMIDKNQIILTKLFAKRADIKAIGGDYSGVDKEIEKTSREIKRYSLKFEKTKQLILKVKYNAESKISNTIEKNIHQKIDQNNADSDKILELKEKINIDEAIVEIKKITSSDNRVHFIAIIIDSKPSKKLPEIIVMKNVENRMQKEEYKYYLNTIESEADGHSFDIFWKDIANALNKNNINTVFLLTEGIYENISVNALYNSKTKKYVVEELKIVNLY